MYQPHFFLVYIIVSAWVLIPLSKPQTSIFFSPPSTEEMNKTPQADKMPDNSNMLHMFNNNIFTDFRTAYKHILIPSYIIRLIYQNQNVTKLNINWSFGWSRPRSTLEIEPSKPHFILKSLFWQKHSKLPRQISVAGIL